MENKYYTPSIEEFHVGFEFEIHLMSVGGLVILDGATKEVHRLSEADIKVWEPTIYNNDVIFGRPLSEIQELISNSQIRVKYLDREDIESLGWLHTDRSIDDWFKWEQPIRLESGHRIKFIMHYGYHDHKLTIKGDDGGGETCFFEGYVNNKSEFKKVMKQLTIN